MRRRTQTIAILLALCLASLVRAQSAPPMPPLADKIPDDAYFYMGWSGADAMSATPAYQQSHLKALLDSTNLRQVMSQTIPQVLAKVAEKGGPEAAEAVDTFKLIGGTLWRYPSAAYFTINLDGGFPMPHAAIFARAGKDVLAIQQRLDQLLAQLPAAPEVPVRTFVVDDLVGVSVGFDEGAMALAGADGKSKPLSAAPGFLAGLAQVGSPKDEAASIFYFDNDVMMSIMDRVMPMAPPEPAERWPKIKDALGLGGLHRVIAVSGFDGKDWSERVFVDVPAPRRGIFSMLEPSPIPDEMLQMVPVGATDVAAGGINLAKVIEDVRAMLGEIEPEAQTKFNQLFGVVQMYTTVNLEKDLFAALGEHWVFYNDPALTGLGMTGVIGVNKLADAAKAERSLSNITNALNNTLAGLLRDKEVEISVRQAKAGDITVNYLAVPFVSPSWVIKDGYLYIALYPQNAIAAAKQGKPKSSILENAGFVAMKKRLGAAQPSSLRYADLPRALPSNYQTMLMISRTAMGLADLFGIHPPELVLPPIDELAKHLSPAGGVGWADEQGFHAKTVSPFPGAELMSGPGAAAILVAPAIGAGIAMPAIQKGRENSERVRCAANMRMIGQTMVLYANGNNGQFPPDLGTLVTTPDLMPQAFLCPGTKKNIPRDWDKLDNDKKAAWVNKSSDYVYLGAGMKNDTPAETILLYEHERDHGRQGMNMLFGDGHVEWQEMAEARELIAKQKQK